MKIELVSDNSFTIFINNKYIKSIDYDDKNEIVDVVKDIIFKFKDKLNLRGFYKVKVFVNSKLGLFLNIIKIEDMEFSNSIDLRVIVCMNEKIYFKTAYYEVIPENIKTKFIKNYFYIDVDDIDNVFDILEFGKFVYGDTLYKQINKKN